jgi:transketolase
MSDIATRDAFGKALIAAGHKHKNVVVFSLDLKGATKTDGFLREFPERFFEMGIAEANGISTSAGMALLGFRPFISSFGAFITGRYDMIRQSVAGNRAGVVVVGSHAGLAIGKDGATQMGLEDIALMRVLPNMSVIQPADDLETYQVVEYLANNNSPCYLRICRQPVPRVHDKNYKFKFGKGVIIREGADLTIIATGGTVSPSIEAAQTLIEDGISARVVNISTLKPIDVELLYQCAEETSAILSVEDHSVIGGMGSAIAEALSQRDGKNVPFRIHGVPDVFGESGDPKDLYKKYLLDHEGIAKVARELFKRVSK